MSNPTEADNNHMAPRPIMIAVGGDSGTGKTTLCRGLDLIFGAERIETISLDDYHSLDREQRKAVGLTALNPRANNFAAMEEDMWALREGRAIDKPIYDHTDGTFKGPEHLEPKEIVVVQGLFPLYTRALRSLFDVTVWLDPETEIKAAWKIQRDTLQRGYSEAEGPRGDGKARSRRRSVHQPASQIGRSDGDLLPAGRLRDEARPGETLRAHPQGRPLPRARLFRV